MSRYYAATLSCLLQGTCVCFDVFSPRTINVTSAIRVYMRVCDKCASLQTLSFPGSIVACCMLDGIDASQVPNCGPIGSRGASTRICFWSLPDIYSFIHKLHPYCYSSTYSYCCCCTSTATTYDIACYELLVTNTITPAICY